MQGYVLILLFLTPFLVLAVTSGKHLTLMLLLTGGIPVTLLMPQTRFFSLHPQAAFLSGMLLAILIASFLRISAVLKEGLRFPAFLVFFTYALLSLVWADNLLFGLRMIAKLFAPFLFLLAALVFLRREWDLLCAEWMVFACCLLVLAIALANTLFNGFLGDDPYWVQRRILTAPWMSPANFSFLIGSGALLALGNFFQSRKVRYLFLHGLFFAAVCWAFTRISIAGLVVATGLLVFRMARSPLAKAVVPVALCGTFVVSFFMIDTLRARMFKNPDVSFTMLAQSTPEKVESMLITSGRTALWKQAVDRFLHVSPVIGKGIGSVDAWLERRLLPSRLHSEYLRLLCDLGVGGLLLYLAAMLQMFLRVRRAGSAARDDRTWKFASVAMAALVYYAITMVTDNSLNYVTEFGMYVFSFAAFALASSEIARSAEGACRVGGA
jgi:hypothetical protein